MMKRGDSMDVRGFRSHFPTLQGDGVSSILTMLA